MHLACVFTRLEIGCIGLISLALAFPVHTHSVLVVKRQVVVMIAYVIIKRSIMIMPMVISLSLRVTRY